MSKTRFKGGPGNAPLGTFCVESRDKFIGFLIESKLQAGGFFWFLCWTGRYADSWLSSSSGWRQRLIVRLTGGGLKRDEMWKSVKELSNGLGLTLGSEVLLHSFRTRWLKLMDTILIISFVRISMSLLEDWFPEWHFPEWNFPEWKKASSDENPAQRISRCRVSRCRCWYSVEWSVELLENYQL